VYKYLIIIVLLFWGTILSAQGNELIHTPVTQYTLGDPLIYEVQYTGFNAEIASMVLLLREAGVRDFRQHRFRFENELWRLQLEAANLRPGAMEYIIVATLRDGKSLSLPAVDPYSRPFQMQESDLPQMEEGGAVLQDILILTPEPGKQSAGKTLEIALSMFSLEAPDTSSARLFINGIDFSSYLNVSSDLVIASIPGELLRGVRQRIQFTINDGSGQPLPPLQWESSFSLQLREGQSLALPSGKINILARKETIKDQPDDLLRAQVYLNGRYNKLNYELRSIYGTDEDPAYQARNIYNLNFRHPKFDLYLGDFNPMFNRLSLWGNRLRGLDLALNLKYFKAEFIGGELLRKVQGVVVADTAAQRWTLQDYTYQRSLYGARAAIFPWENVGFNVNFLKVRDDTSSVRLLDYFSAGELLSQSIAKTGGNPQDNFIIGLGSEISFDRRHFLWQQDLVFSLYNRNIVQGTQDLIAIGDTLMPYSQIGLGLEADWLESLFIINENAVYPFPVKASGDSYKAAPFRFSEYPSIAYHSSLKLNYFNNYIVVEYRYTAPEFVSLANPVNISDQQKLDLSDRVRLFQNRLFLNLRLLIQNDNVLQRQTENRTSLISPSVGFTLMPGGNWPGINADLRYYDRQNDALWRDTTLTDERIDNRTLYQSYSLTQPIHFLGLQNHLNLLVSISDRSDRIQNRPAAYNQNDLSALLVNSSLKTHWSKGLVTNILFNFNDNSAAGFHFTTQTAGGSATLNFLNQKLQWMNRYKFTNATGDLEYAQNTLESEARFRYQQHEFILSYYLSLLNQSAGNETMSRIQMIYGFTI
jgi:hypothetical protein